MAEPERTDPPSSATRMHLLPCAVDYTGPANVNAYFRPTATDHAADGATVLDATFRGRQLRGTELQLPPTYAGYVLESAAGRPQQEVARFQALTYWNHDADPAPTDAVQRALGWLPLAAEVHKRVTAQSVDALLQEEAGGCPSAPQADG